MNKKIFIKYQIKSLLPFASIACVFLLIVAFFSGLESGENSSKFINLNDSIERVFFYDSPAFSIMGIATVGFAALAPISIFSYRTSLKEQEFYKQSPIPKNKLLLIRLLIMSILFAIAILLALLVFLFAAKIDSNNATEALRANFIFWKILITYLIFTSAAIIQLLISSFFANFCNTNVTILFASIFGSLLITFGYFVLLSYYGDNINREIIPYFNYFYPLDIFPGGFGLIKSHEILLSYTMTKGTVNYFVLFNHESKSIYIVMCIINIILPMLLAIGAALFFFFQKEPSAEYAGKPKDRSIIPSIVFYAVCAIGFLCFATEFRIRDIFSIAVILIIMVFYYLANCARTNSIKVSTNELIALICCSIIPLGIGMIISTI